MNYVTIDYCNRDVEVSFYIEPGDNGDYYQPPSPLEVGDVCTIRRMIITKCCKETLVDVGIETIPYLYKGNSDLWMD